SDGTALAVTGGDRLRLWDLATGEPRTPRSWRTDPVNSVAISRRSTGSPVVVAAAWDHRIWVIDPIVQHNRLLRAHHHGGDWETRALTAARLSDGRTLAVASDSLSVRRWDVATAGEIGQPIKSRSHVTAIATALLPNGDAVLLTAHRDRRLRVWDLDLGVLVGESDEAATASHVLSAVELADGQVVVAGDLDNAVQLWDVPTAQALSPPLCGHTGAVTAVSTG